MTKRMSCKILALLLALCMLCGCGTKKVTVKAPSKEAEKVEVEEEAKTKMPDDPNAVRMHFFTVEGVDNWGDCTYIEFPNGENMLIDVGLSAATRQIVEVLLDQGIDRINHLVFSHGHADHVQGLSNILGNMTVDHAYSNGYFTTDFQWVLRDLESRGVEHTVLTAGDKFQIGDVKFDILWPLKENVAVSPQNDSKAAYGPGSTEDMNNSSIVMKMIYGENTVLFTGDLYVSGEAAFLKHYMKDLSVLKSDFLKIMHHGAETSSSEEMVKAISPSYGVSMGTRTMTKEVYDRYAGVGCNVYMSWMNGNIYVSMDGKKIEMTADNPEIADFYKTGSGSLPNADQSTLKEGE